MHLSELTQINRSIIGLINIFKNSNRTLKILRGGTVGMPVAKAARRQRQDGWLSPGVVRFCSGILQQGHT